MSNETAQRSVLFVCMGNICRSPTAEGIVLHVADEMGAADHLFVDSAGTTGYHAGERADRRMRQAARERGYDLTSRSRQVTANDFERFDLIVAMDHENVRDLGRFGTARQGQVRLLSSFLDGGWPDEVPDPYYGGADGFFYVIDMIEAAAEGIVESLTGSDAEAT